MNDDSEGGAPGSRHAALVAALALLTTVTSVVTSLGAPLVPSIAADYQVSLPTAQWTLTATLLTGAVATPVVGRLGSGRTRRPVILLGLVTVTVGLVLAALPLGFGVLIAGRALQGVGLALTPVALAVARDVLPATRMAGTLALLSVAGVAGAGLGFPLTSLVAGAAGLDMAFWLGAVLTAGTLAMSARHLPRSSAPESQRVDWIGAVLVTGGILAVLLVASQGDSWGWTAPVTLILLTVGVAAIGTWIPWTLTARQPLVDLRLAARPAAMGAHLTALLAGVGMYMGLTLVVTVVQADPATGWGLGHPVAVAGLMMLPYSVCSVAASRLALLAGRYLEPRRVLPIGCGVYLLSNVFLAAAHEQVWQLLLAMAVAGLGSGCTFAMIPLLLVRAVPAAETGSALALQQVLRYVGFSIGSALGVTILRLASRGSMPDERGMVAAASATALVCGLAGAIAWLSTRRDTS